MSDTLRESISAMLDGEADQLELHRVLKQSEQDPGVRQQWQRFQVASSVLRREHNQWQQLDISRGVLAAIAAEPALSAGRSLPAWIRPVASMAVAASVTAAVLLGTQLYQQTQPLPVASGSQLAASEPFESVSSPVVPSGGVTMQASSTYGDFGGATAAQQQSRQRAQADALAAERMRYYLYNHVENSSLNASSGLLPFARVEVVPAQAPVAAPTP